MKTPSSSGKKKKKISGVSPGMDLTRFGFSVKTKRSASEVVVVASSSPPKSASAKNNNNNNNAGNNNNNNNEDDSNMESPLKRHKASSSSPAVNNNSRGVASGLVGKGKENGTTAASTPVENDKKKSPAKTTTTTATTASRTALYDLTQSTSSEEGPSTNKNGGNKAVNNNDGANNNNLASLGGLASSIANQIVAASSVTNDTKNNTTQQQQQQPEKQRRGKRDKVIPNKTKVATGTNNSMEQTKPRSSSSATTIPAVAKSLSPSKTKSGNTNNNNNNFQALALVRVIDPHEITCSTAVANARRQDSKQHNTTTKQQQQSWTPRPIFNGAILGRSSSSANAKSNFVDLGIGNRCMGISRNHITILTVRVKSSVVDESTSQNLSQTSAASSSTKNSTSQCDQSTVTLQVSDNASNGVNVHRTKRGSRKATFLSKGEKMTLRVGDALEFYSNEKLCYCVVGLESSSQDDVLMMDDDGKKTHNNVVGKSGEKQNEVIVVDVDEKRASAASAAAIIKKRNSYEGSTNGEEEEKKKRNLTKLNVTDEVVIVDANKQSMDASKAPLKTPTNGTSNGTTFSAAAAKSSSVEEIEDTPRFPPAATLPISHVKSATKTTVAKRLDQKLQKSPMGPKSPTKVSSNDENRVDLATVDAAADDLEIANIITEQQEESEMIKKGDTVKARFEVKDWFGESQLEWYFGTVTRVRKSKKSSSTQSYEIDVLYADQEKDTLPFPDDDVEKVDDHSYPDSFFVGDSVDCFHQDGLRPGHEGKWYRGRIASISEDGSSCDVLYIDGDVSFIECDVTLVES